MTAPEKLAQIAAECAILVLKVDGLRAAMVGVPTPADVALRLNDLAAQVRVIYDIAESK